MRHPNKGGGPLGSDPGDPQGSSRRNASKSSGAATACKVRDLQLEVHRHEGAAMLAGKIVEFTVAPHTPELVARAAVAICSAFRLPLRLRHEVEHRLRLAIAWGSL